VSRLDQKFITRAKKAAREAAPEMAGVEPSISTRVAHGKSGATVHILTFQKEMRLPDGARLKRVVRVTMDEQGEILKVSSSK